jgi:hypothetical protein
MEDFADTVALFINRPEELILTSPNRFNGMRQIFGEFMPHYAATQELQDQRIGTDRIFRSRIGISDLAAKHTYLSHESQ